MNLLKNIRLYTLLLHLFALHSFAVGIALIVLPFGVLSWFGFTIDPYRFFSTQGGVFHIVMSVAYLLASQNPVRETNMILFIIIAKWIAFFFLASYFLFVELVPVIAMSAVGDGLMGLMLLMFFMEHNTEEPAGND